MPNPRKQVERQEDQPFCKLKPLQVGLHFEAPCSAAMTEDFTNSTCLLCLSHFNFQNSAA